MKVALTGLAVTAAVMLFGWIVSLVRRDVSDVDALWGPAIALAGVVYLLLLGPSPRGQVAVALAGLWALRLALHVLWRKRDQGEDRRYREIRARNDPGFQWKSLYLVFGLQALLGWVITFPLLGAVAAGGSIGMLDAIGIALFAFGFVWEAIADWQLARFQTGAAADGVMDRGLWRYSRHPNYFGECCLWWGLWLLAAAGGAWWTAVGPALLTLFLLRVSGIALTEKDIADRRPAYRDYMRRTSAFIPRPRS